VSVFEELWRRDHWRHAESELDLASYARQLELVADRRYGRALELGSGAGIFTRLLAALADEVVGVDVAPSAIERARAGAPTNVHFRLADVREFDPVVEGPWDLAVMSETIYCLGCEWTLFELGWLASRLYESLRPSGRFLMANTYGREQDHVMRPWFINTYQDLFRNVGFTLAHEEVLRGVKDAVAFDVLLTLHER
jgi:SAM-dependent methyltransferase